MDFMIFNKFRKLGDFFPKPLTLNSEIRRLELTFVCRVGWRVGAGMKASRLTRREKQRVERPG